MDERLIKLKDEMDAAARNACKVEPDDLCRLRTGHLRARAGSYGQYFSAWVIAYGMLRDYGMYTLYPLLQIAQDRRFDIYQVKELLKSFDPPYSEYLGYSGFDTLRNFSGRIREIVDTTESRDDVLAALVSFTRYVNQMAAWSHHYFPWNIGAELKYDQGAESGQDQHAANSSLKQRPDLSLLEVGRRVTLTWSPPGLSATVVLAESANPELCGDLLRAMPFRVLQDHAVVTGESIYAWVPIVSFAPVRNYERICDAPVGRVRFSQATGNKLVIQYGETTETLPVPVLGHVLEEHLDVIKEVGRLVWKSTFETKEPVWLDVTLQ